MANTSSGMPVWVHHARACVAKACAVSAVGHDDADVAIWKVADHAADTGVDAFLLIADHVICTGYIETLVGGFVYSLSEDEVDKDGLIRFSKLGNDLLLILFTF